MEFDVVVVGAGPAGSVAAWAAAEAGCDVLILERKAEIGVPKQCAEGISAHGLEHAGIEPQDEWIATEISRALIYAPNGKEFEVPGDGYVLERRVFDKWLVVRAVEAGAEVELLAHARRALLDEGRVVGVEYEGEDGVHEVRARIVIAADGIESRIGRTAGLVPSLKPVEMCTCAQYEMVGVDVEEDATHFFVDAEFFPGGYFWIFPKGEGRANVGLGIRGSESEPGDALKVLNRALEDHELISEAVADAVPVEVNVGGVPVCGPVERTYGDGILLVGDAARQVNPLTGGGLHTSLVCGRIAGEVAAEAIEEDDTSASFLKRYQDRWEEEFGKTFKYALKASKIFSEMSNEELNALAEALDREDILRLVKGEEVVKVAKKVISRKPSLLKYAKHLMK
ncbi:NAD(P)/FAD-dependent oxidoreductase [Methanopyrus kandleri]|uniref:Digeranylgeranylglycerophospholipid reductase 2 n=3 Tax=Methanopyrus kandleri TaxID=2320 RepID=GGR2_METKA|nr:NAD(P)/FAD-dependent oxidoreductase [Methanopyrus kandleri]Q8TUV8.2 RecName: Full=Digeranylgeranylglycerophospholipid reductase 2; Short=DGGGPL reductase 2; AltName: Full=2,3-bis-O-geranylgeranylglyceryl phosphate reductase 2; AltName: Full=Geranylgeranyl reductase 2; Short=GGR 2 [Methanopyrus kandleri AV19]